MVVVYSKAHYIELAIASILLLVNYYTAVYYFFSNGFFYFSVVFTLLFLVYAFVYIMKGNELANKGRLSRYMHALFIAIVVSFFASLLTSDSVLTGILTLYIPFFSYVGVTFALVLPLLFLSYKGISLIGTDKKSACLFFLAALALLLVYSLIFAKFFVISDEEFIRFEGAQMLLNGANPYSTAISPLLFVSPPISTATLTTTNKIVNIVDYPALYFLSYLPFYFLGGGKIDAIPTVYMPVQMAIFTFILLFAFVYLLKREDILKPELILFIFFASAVAIVATPAESLLTALIILAYIKIESRYAWVFLGLCVAIQELLWLPVLFLLVYSASNYGIKKLARDVAGIFAVFFLFNGYFILINPAAYLSAVFTPLNSLILPINAAPLAFLLLKTYPILMYTHVQIFAAVALLMLALFLYFNKKQLLFLFSLIPFMFLINNNFTYYPFFIFLMFFAIQFGEKEIRKGMIEGKPKWKKEVFYLALIIIVTAIAGIMYSSHAAYEQNFNISIQNQSLKVDYRSATTFDYLNLFHRNLTNNTIYQFTFVFDGRTELGQNLVYPEVNITLPANSSSNGFAVRLPWFDAAYPIICAAPELFRGAYFYASSAVCTASS